MNKKCGAIQKSDEKLEIDIFDENWYILKWEIQSFLVDKKTFEQKLMPYMHS